MNAPSRPGAALIPAACVAVLFFLLGWAQPAAAGELSGVTYGGPGATDAAEDGLIVSTTRVSYRASPRLALVGTGILGYGSRHRRLITGGGVGVQLGTRIGVLSPYVIASVLRQHEQPFEQAIDMPLDAVVPRGEGARRLTGGQIAAGVDLPLWRFRGLELFSSAEVWTSHFYDAPGADTYWGANFGLGARLDLAYAAFASEFRKPSR